MEGNTYVSYIYRQKFLKKGFVQLGRKINKGLSLLLTKSTAMTKSNLLIIITLPIKVVVMILTTFFQLIKCEKLKLIPIIIFNSTLSMSPVAWRIVPLKVIKKSSIMLSFQFLCNIYIYIYIYQRSAEKESNRQKGSKNEIWMQYVVCSIENKDESSNKII